MAETMDSGIVVKGRKIQLPLSKEDEKFLISKGKDPVVETLKLRTREMEARESGEDFQQHPTLGASMTDTSDFFANSEIEYDTDEEEDEDAPYSEWNNQELMAELQERKLPTGGSKLEKIKRLEEDDAKPKTGEPVSNG